MVKRVHKKTKMFSMMVLLTASIFFLSPFLHGEKSYEFEVNFSQEELAFSKANGHDLVLMPRYSTTGERGQPQLPSVRYYVAIPEGMAAAGVRVKSMEKETVQGNYLIHPTQAPVSNAAEARSFVKDGSIYQSSSLFPKVLGDIGPAADLAGQNLAIVLIYPLQYQPASGTLILHKRLSFMLDLKKTDRPSDRPRIMTRLGQRRYERMLTQMVINPEDVEVRPLEAVVKPGGRTQAYDYVLVSQADCLPFWEELVEWRTKLGFKGTMVDIEWIKTNYTGTDTYEKIRSFAIDANSNWGTSYIFMGHDAPEIPVKSKDFGGTAASDMYYADYDDDYLVEVAVGRWPVYGEFGDVVTCVNKVMAYEKNPPLENFCDEFLMLGFDLDSQTKGENGKKWLKQNVIPLIFDYTNVFDTDTTPPTHKEAAKTGFNEGVNFVNHIDHGDTDKLGTGIQWRPTWYIDASDVDDLVHPGEYSIMYSTACQIGHFDAAAYHCIMEEFLWNYQGGLVGLCANTRNGLYYVTVPLSLSGEYEKEWWTSIFDGYVGGWYLTGDIWADHKNRLVPVNPDITTKRFCCYELELFGDPCLWIWTADPEELTVTCDDRINPESQTYSVTVQDGGSGVWDAQICLWKGDELHDVGWTNGSGKASIAIAPQSQVFMDVTVKATNYLVYEATCEVNWLTHPNVAPRAGSEETLFTYYVDVLTPGEAAPERVYIHVDGEYAGEMSLHSGSAGNGTYAYSTYLRGIGFHDAVFYLDLGAEAKLSQNSDKLFCLPTDTTQTFHHPRVVELMGGDPEPKFDRQYN